MPRDSQKGFILAASLWILAAITLAVGYFAAWVENTLDEAQLQRQAVREEIDVLSTQGVILYLLGTQRLTLAGLTVPDDVGATPDPLQVLGDGEEVTVLPVGGELRVDGRPYRGLGGARFSLQDEWGLIALNGFNSGHLKHLLGLLEVPADLRVPLIDKLKDYTDYDNLHRLNGAEADAYRRAGRPGPANRELITAAEARKVLGWAEQTALWDNRRLPRLAASSGAGIPNINSAPLEVVQAVLGVDRATAQVVVDAREEAPIRGIGQLEATIRRSLDLDPMGFVSLPSRYYRIALWGEGSRRMRELHVELTPTGDGSPWIIDHLLTVTNALDGESAPDATGIELLGAPRPQ